MKILVEGHTYDAALVKDICGDFAQASDGKVKISRVGYWFSRQIGDCILSLPKVVTDEGGKTAFGGLNHEDLIDGFSKDGKLGETQREFVKSFCLTTYRAISTFSSLNPDSEIVHRPASTRDSSHDDAINGTYLDTILSILRFFSENKDYFIFITRNLHSGFERINWRKTTQKTIPIFFGDSPFYPDAVNRKKMIDFDEELLVIFHSILHYISTELGIGVKTECNFNIVTGALFETYLEGKGIARLNAIKHKYFSDKDIHIWRLCRDFFLKSSRISQDSSAEDYLFVDSFEIMFEGMMNHLISDTDIPDVLKIQKDGKIVDHLFVYESPIDGMDIYYIGDSKYYSIGSSVGDYSVYKQFTYAKNIIQYHFIQSMKRKLDEISYRDPLTEGYNVMPNFFISAYIPDSHNYNDSGLKQRHFGIGSPEEAKHRIFHFENRLFDRDTLWLSHFDINLLYVMSLYAEDDFSEQAIFKSTFKKKVLDATKEYLRDRYDFYKIDPSPLDTATFVKRHFRLLIGKIYRMPDGSLLLALEKGHTDNEKVLDQIKEHATVECFRSAACLCD